MDSARSLRVYPAVQGDLNPGSGETGRAFSHYYTGISSSHPNGLRDEPVKRWG